jgi:hypothetical protein
VWDDIASSGSGARLDTIADDGWTDRRGFWARRSRIKSGNEPASVSRQSFSCSSAVALRFKLLSNRMTPMKFSRSAGERLSFSVGGWTKKAGAQWNGRDIEDTVLGSGQGPCDGPVTVKDARDRTELRRARCLSALSYGTYAAETCVVRRASWGSASKQTA